jgi:hypothetical protein
MGGCGQRDASGGCAKTRSQTGVNPCDCHAVKRDIALSRATVRLKADVAIPSSAPHAFTPPPVCVMAPNGARSPRRVAPSRRSQRSSRRPQPYPLDTPNRTLSTPSTAPSRRPRPPTSATLNDALPLRVHRAQRPACPAPNGAYLPRPVSSVCPSHGPRPPRPTACGLRVQRRAASASNGVRPPRPTACVSRAQRRAFAALNGPCSPRPTTRVCSAQRLVLVVRHAQPCAIAELNRARSPCWTKYAPRAPARHGIFVRTSSSHMSCNKELTRGIQVALQTSCRTVSTYYPCSVLHFPCPYCCCRGSQPCSWFLHTKVRLVYRRVYCGIMLCSPLATILCCFLYPVINE